jgi:hypothetical protein
MSNMIKNQVRSYFFYNLDFIFVFFFLLSSIFIFYWLFGLSLNQLRRLSQVLKKNLIYLILNLS